MCNKLKVIIMQGQSCLGKSTLCRKLSGIISDCTYLYVDKYKEKKLGLLRVRFCGGAAGIIRFLQNGISLGFKKTYKRGCFRINHNR